MVRTHRQHRLNFDHTDAIRRLDDIARRSIASVTLPAEANALHGLGHAATNEDHLVVARALRSAGAVAPDEAFAHVAFWIIRIAEDRIFGPHHRSLHPELERISAKMATIEQAHGLSEDESWPRGQGPQEWQRLSDEFDRVYHRICAECLRRYGEPDMAELYLRDRAEFDRRFQHGCGRLAGETPLEAAATA